jgi:hypothetical protein
MGIYQDCLFISVILISIYLIGNATKSISETFVWTSVPLLGIGVLCQLLEQLGLEATAAQLSLYIAISLLLTVVASRRRRIDSGKTQSHSVSKYIFLIASAIVFFSLIISRMLSQHGEAGVLVQFAHFTGAEDNGAWLDVAARMASGQSINFGQVGGPLVVFLAICQSIGRIISKILSSNSNELAATANTLLVAYSMIFVMVSVPLTISVSKLGTKGKKLKLILVNIAIWFLACGGFALAQSSGHLSFEFAMIYYLFGITWFYYRPASANFENLLVVTCLILVSPVWLPLNLVGILLVIPAYFYTKESVRDSKANLLLTGCMDTMVIVCLFILGQSVKYASSTIAQTKNLFSADGGTAGVSSSATIALLVGIFVLIILDRESKQQEESDLKVVLAAITYVLIITFANYWLTGSSGYGSTKLYFGLSLILFPLMIQKIVSHYVLEDDMDNSWKIVSAVIVLVTLFSLVDGRGSAITWYLSPNQFTKVETRQKPSWQDFIQITSESKRLNSLPIGCVTIDDSGDISADMDTYTCTRLLVSLAGKWSDSLPLIEFQLMPDEKRISQLINLDINLYDSNLLQLYVVDHKVLGTIKISDFIESYSQK